MQATSSLLGQHAVQCTPYTVLSLHHLVANTHTSNSAVPVLVPKTTPRGINVTAFYKAQMPFLSIIQRTWIGYGVRSAYSNRDGQAE